MRIFYTTDIHLDRTTAPSGHVDEICKNLAALGHTVTVYVPASGDYRAPQGYHFVFLRVPKVARSFFFQTVLFFRLAWDLLKEKPDFIYCRQSHLLIVPTLLGNMFGVPIALEVNVRFDKDGNLNKGILSRTLSFVGVFTCLEFLNLRCSSRIIAVHPHIKDHLVTKYHVPPEKIIVLTNGVDTDVFLPISTGSAHEGVTIGYIGTLHPWQGLDYFLEAARMVHADRPRVMFLIVGDGPQRQRISRIIESTGMAGFVDLRPAVAHTDVPHAINSLDIGVCYFTNAKIGAGSPFKVYEYLACAKPVLVSDLPGWRDDFEDTVVYVKPESSRELADAMIALADDAGERQRLGAKGRAFVEKGRTWRSVAQRTALFLETALT